jgi:predicted DNA-binding transcriptional regulator YafY
MAQLLALLAEEGIPAERKGIYADILALQEAGLDICYRGGQAGGWFVRKRLFQTAELKILADLVQAAHVLSPRKSRQLVEKLGRLTNVQNAALTQEAAGVRRVKTSNESVYYHVEVLQQAILERRVVAFRYFTYDNRKKKRFGREGADYTLSPRALFWEHGRYYLSGYDHLHAQPRRFRVDRMQEIESREEAQPQAAAAAEEGAPRGEETKVWLRCEGESAGLILDHFGMDCDLAPEESGSALLTARVRIDAFFWGWLFGMGSRVELIGPLWAVRVYQQQIRDALQQYGGAV